jgi:hypothetical protein
MADVRKAGFKVSYRIGEIKMEALLYIPLTD